MQFIKNVISYLCRLTEKETGYKEQSSVKLQEWVKALAPLQEWFVKSEQKLDSLENLESNMNNLKRQNQEYLVSLLGLFSNVISRFRGGACKRRDNAAIELTNFLLCLTALVQHQKSFW